MNILSLTLHNFKTVNVFGHNITIPKDIKSIAIDSNGDVYGFFSVDIVPNYEEFTYIWDYSWDALTAGGISQINARYYYIGHVQYNGEWDEKTSKIIID